MNGGLVRVLSPVLDFRKPNTMQLRKAEHIFNGARCGCRACPAAIRPFP